MEFAKIEKHMLHRDSAKLRWMRHMWAFVNAQVIKEIDLSMHLKITRTSHLILKYYKDIGECLVNFTKGYENLSPVLDLPPIQHVPKLFSGVTDEEKDRVSEVRKNTFFGTMMEGLPGGGFNGVII